MTVIGCRRFDIRHSFWKCSDFGASYLRQYDPVVRSVLRHVGTLSHLDITFDSGFTVDRCQEGSGTRRKNAAMEDGSDRQAQSLWTSLRPTLIQDYRGRHLLPLQTS